MYLSQAKRASATRFAAISDIPPLMFDREEITASSWGAHGAGVGGMQLTRLQIAPFAD